MRNYKILLKIIAPPLICVLLFKMISIHIGNSIPILLFGLVIGIFNWNAHKFNPYLGIALSVLIAYICYGLGLLSFGIFMPIRDLIVNNTDLFVNKDKLGRIAYIISPFVIAPLLTFIAYRFIFRIQKTKLTYIIVIVSILVLVLQAYLFFKKIDLSSSNLKYNILNPYITWQGIMLLSLQLILYQEELKVLFRPKKSI